MAARALLAVALCAAAGAARREGAECEWCPECAPAEAQAQGAARCRLETAALDEFFYRIDNDTKLRISFTGQYLKLWCQAAGAGVGGGVTLASASLPRLPRPATLHRVALHACPPPRDTYALALAALNVRALDVLELTALPAAPPLRADHLAGLASLETLVLTGAGAGEAAPRLPAALLEPLRALRSLHVQDVRLPAGEPLALPRSLRQLRARGAGLGALAGAAQLAALPELGALVLEDPSLRAPPPLAAAPALRQVVLVAPLDALPPLHHLHNATFSGARDVALVGACGGLRRLRVERPAGAPSRGWLAGCARLEELELVALPGAPPADLLAGLPQLRRLLVQRCALAALPAALLAPARELRDLDLAHNRLTHLDGDAFSSLTQLELLDLSGNLLAAHALAPLLAPLGALRVLRLDNNPLGDLCPRSSSLLLTQELSPLAHLHRLRELSLSGTRATRLCADWRRDLRALRRLLLRANNITELAGADLRWAAREGGGGDPLLLDLSGNQLAALVLTRADWLAAPPRAAAAATVEVVTTHPLRCDCRAYWLARALRDARLRATFPRALACDRTEGPLHDVPLEQLECALDACAAGCACAWRPGPGDNATVVVARCARAGLAALPRLPRLPPSARVHLLAPDNAIAALAAADLPAGLQMLDVSGNRLTVLDGDTLRALFGAGGEGGEARVRLARNPLACACAARDTLLALQAHDARVEDYAEVRCADGRAVRELDVRALCAAGAGAGAGALAGALGALGAALALAGALALAARRHTRLRLKAFLLARGLCLRWTRPSDDDDCKYEYDAFLSYSHRDGAFAERLVAELEGGARPLRLCIHDRDWGIGEWIPAQIARSVATSRRTVILLSEHFLRSGWARAEFREAHARSLRDARPRLVVVVLGAAPPPGLDAELGHYVRDHTYVRWGEPAFWEKLRLALPAPRTLPRAVAPPALAAAPLAKLSALPPTAPAPAADTSPCA